MATLPPAFFQFEPSEIASITQARPLRVTTTSNHGYLTGMTIRFVIPLNWGMQEIAFKHFPIKKISDTEFDVYVSLTPEVPLDGRAFSALIDPNDGTIAMVNMFGESSCQIQNLIWQSNTVFCDSQISDATSNIKEFLT